MEPVSGSAFRHESMPQALQLTAIRVADVFVLIAKVYSSILQSATACRDAMPTVGERQAATMVDCGTLLPACPLHL